MNIQNRDNFFTAGAHAIKKLKIFRSCSRFKTLLQLFSTIEIVSVVVAIEQQTVFCSDLLFLFNNLNILLMNSNNFIRVQKKYFFKFEFSKMIEFFRVRSPALELPATYLTLLEGGIVTSKLVGLFFTLAL